MNVFESLPTPGTEVMPDSEKEYDIICSWCNKLMGKTKDTGGPSHGICDDCQKNNFPEFKI